MIRLPTTFASLTAAALLAASTEAHARASFDEKSGSLRLTAGDDAVLLHDFETADSLVGTSLGRWDESRYVVQRSPIDKPETIAERLTDPSNAVEGSHALRLGADGQGLVIDDPAVLAKLANGKFEVTLWARTDGSDLVLQVDYDGATADPGYVSFASVQGVRTGRETSDGWAEFVAGPLDGSIWGTGVSAILVVPPMSVLGGVTNGAFLVDALEIRKVAGMPLEPRACTQQNVDAVCGSDGDCMYGHCVPSAVTWGLLPSLAQRKYIAERWTHFATTVIGDRTSMATGVDVFAPMARRLAETASSSREFFGGMNLLVSRLRNNHTSLGAVLNYSDFGPQAFQSDTGLLGACFGVVEKDLLGGGLGYGVSYGALESPAGTLLRKGDVLVAIDGRDPKEWVDEFWPRYAYTVAGDPRADWASSAEVLSILVSKRASTMTLARCASSTACEGASRTTIDVDVATALYAAVKARTPRGASHECSPRFFASARTEEAAADGETVFVKAKDDGVTDVEFDGVGSDSRWVSAFERFFVSPPARFVMDARVGNGGDADAVQLLLDAMRDTSDPVVGIMVGRGTYGATEPADLFTKLHGCLTGTDPDPWKCRVNPAGAAGTKVTSAPAAHSRIAWLNTRDVSANDYTPRLLKGRSNFRIFAPHPTSGAFGTLTSTPAVWTGWYKGAVQVQDSRFGVDFDHAVSSPWESGHGVEPDVVVAQKISDLIDGVDTMISVAHAWLVEN